MRFTFMHEAGAERMRGTITTMTVSYSDEQAAEFQHVLKCLQRGASHSDAHMFRVLFEQVEANRKAIADLRDEFEDHEHLDGMSDSTTGPRS